MDVKKIGRIPDGGGWRVLGRRRSGPRQKVGYDYVHTLIDDHTRLAYSEILSDEKGETCAGFLTRGLAWFAARGIPHIERLMTDNAWAYRWSLRQVCADHGIRQIFIKPHCPWTNGKVERFNKTLASEWAYRQPFTSNTQRTEAFHPWLHSYNYDRPHSSLGNKPPISRVTPTS
jgi:transposase InsO family protein